MQAMDVEMLNALERIATAQLVMAVAMGGFMVIAIAGAILLLNELRFAHRLARSMGRSLDELKPKLGPLIDRAQEVTDDVGHITDDVRRRADAILHTVEDLHRSLRRGGAAAEQRIRRLDAVLEVVQAEAEELLLDAAATAHGVHETARALRGEDAPRRRTSLMDEDQVDEDRMDDDQEEVIG